MHLNDIIHSYIKPHNIFINQARNKLLIGDFGLSGPNNEFVHNPVGAEYYMKLENIIRDDFSIEEDVYNLGIIMLQLFCPMDNFINFMLNYASLDLGEYQLIKFEYYNF